MKLQIGFALLTGLLFSDTMAGGIDINHSGCQLSKVTQNDVFKCPCTGGSGNYDWHFYELPDGWSANKDQLIAPKGKIGKIKNIVDYRFDFKPEELVGGSTQIVSIPSNPQVNGPTNTNVEKVKQIFDNVIEIGGGCGLLKLRPYFLGKGGLYKGDTSNPYLTKLPTDADVDKLLATGSSSDIRVVIINVAQSRANCKDINTWLSNLLQKLRTKISTSKADVDATNQLIATIKAQISTLQTQLTAAQSSVVDINSLTAQVTSLQATITQTQSTQSGLQTQLSQVTASITDFQIQISTIVEQRKQYQQADDNKAAQVDSIEDQIAQLQAQINNLNSQKEAINNERATISQQIADTQVQIDALNVKINAAQLSVNDLNAQIGQAQATITETQAKIDQLEILIHSGNTAQQTVTTIKTQLTDLQQKLVAAQAKLTQAQAVYNDLNGSYEELSKIGDSSYNSCYKTLYNDNNYHFEEDDDGNIEFSDKNSLIKYLTKIFNVAGNLRNIDVTVAVKNTSSSSSSSSSTKTTTSTNTSSSTKTTSSNSSKDKITIKQSNIFCKDWIKAYGNVLDTIFSNIKDGHAFRNDDFTCQSATSSSLKSYKGKIKSISNYYAQVVDEKGSPCVVYFGGCTRIQSVNKGLPQAGDDIYWLGTNKPKGKSNEYNAHHLTCY